METSNMLILDTFLLRRKYKLFKIVAKGSRCCTWAGLRLRLPPGRNRKPWEMRLAKKTQILMLPTSAQVVWHASGEGALEPCSAFIRTRQMRKHLWHTFPFQQMGKFRRKRVLLELFPTRSSCQHACRTCYRLLPGRSTSKAGYLYTDAADGHKDPGGVQCCVDTPAARCAQANRHGLLHTPCSDQGRLVLSQSSGTKRLWAPNRIDAFPWTRWKNYTNFTDPRGGVG